MSSDHERPSGFTHYLRGAIFALLGTANLYLVAYAAGESFNEQYELLSAMVFILLFTVFQRFSLVRRWLINRSDSLGTRIVIAWLLVTAVLMFVGFLTRQTGDFPRRVLLGWLLTTPILFLVAHQVIRFVTLHYFPRTRRSRSAVIVFVSSASQQLAQTLEKYETPQYRPLGFFDDRSPQRTGVSLDKAPILGSTEDLAGYVNRHLVEVVFVVLPAQGAQRAREVMEQLGDTCASVYYLPDFTTFNIAHMRFTEIGGMPVLTLVETPFFGADGLLKRLMDIIFACGLLLCLAPMFFIIAVAIRSTMGRPVFFKQRRYGLDGKPFDVYKFRSMQVIENDNAIRQASRDDPRTTPLGRFLRRTSIDELPQFINVLKGDMSVVGPRPHAVTHNEQYRKLIRRYMVRHKVKPGMTGWAQVNGLRGETRSLEDMQRRVEHDLHYIVSWSPGLDCWIVIRTVWIVFHDRDAY